MSVEEKVALARESRSEHGLGPVLEALGLARSTWYYHQHCESYEERYAHLREPLESIAREHPEYGYRRAAVELRKRYGYRVNHKVVQRLHRLWGLPLMRSTRRPKPNGVRRAITAVGERANLVARMEDIGPFEVSYTDFTELRYAEGRARAHLIAIVDHASKLVRCRL